MIRVVWYHETAHLEGQDVHGHKFSVKAKDVSGFRRTAKGCLIVPDDGPMYEADTTYGEVKAAYLEAKTARPPLCDFAGLRDELGDPGPTGAVGNDSPLPLNSPGGGHLYGGEEDGA